MSDLIRASAPVRLDFAGGWTDVEPFASEEGGLVVNAAITRRMHAEFRPGGEGTGIVAEDLGLELRIPIGAEAAPEGPLALPVAALRMFAPGPGTLRTRGEVPPGSGLGSSGALDVALVAALARVRGEAVPPARMADLGWRLETIEAGHPGGRQDQYAAALGGFHRLGFSAGAVAADRLTIVDGFAEELARRVVICYTGRSRVSGETIARVMGGYVRGNPRITGALRELKQVAGEMAAALEEASFERVAALLDRNWACQQQLDGGMRTPEMERLERAMHAAGAAGGKAAGAGAGGCMFFLMRGNPDAGRRAAEAAGATVLAAGWSMRGVEAC